MKDEIHTMQPADFPQRLREIPDAPEKLYHRGAPLPDTKRYLAVVGSRKYTSYGKHVCRELITGLSGSSVCIVSGLALGIDAIAHKAALEAGLPCVAVPGSGLNDAVLYPRTNQPLAHKILKAGGTLLSEFDPDFKATSWAFPQRNRIMAGLAHAVLVVEATEQSGTLITARLAGEYNRDVFTIPGSIKTAHRAGPHQLIRDGAALIRSSSDILKELGLEELSETNSLPTDLSAEEKEILQALDSPKSKDLLIQQVELSASRVNVLISQMELRGLIIEVNGRLEKK